MHHKLISSRLTNKGNPGYKRDGLKIKKPTGVGSGYTSDNSTESNMTSVAVDHVPLSSGLSHVVRMELGEDPIVPGEDSNSTRIYQGTCSTYPTMLHPVNDPIEQALNTVTLKQEVTEKQKSKIVRQLELAMQKQTEYDPDETYPNATPILASVAILKKWPEKSKGTTTTKLVASGGAAPSDSDHSEYDPIETPEDGKDHDVVTKNESRISHVSSTSQKKRRSPSGRSSPLGRGRKAAAGDQTQTKNKRPRRATQERENEYASSSENDGGSDEDLRFRRYQNQQWTEKFDELLAFKKENGHCQVPHTYPPNPQLARWVKRQRYQFKLKSDKKQSTMTDDRVDLLQEAGFVWDSHAAAWLEKYNELRKYAKKFGTCNLPSTNADYPQLATWVKCQRRQYKLSNEGKVSNMTKERVSLLEKIGFVWGLRKL